VNVVLEQRADGRPARGEGGGGFSDASEYLSL
jgi:hypothetical protein